MKTSRLMLLIGATALLHGCEFSVGTMNSSSGNEFKAERNESGRDAEDREERAQQDETRRFVNSRELAINDRLRERYIDFSFEYPSSWRSIPQQEGSHESNFAQIRAPQRRGSDTINVAFGTAGFNNLENASAREFEQLIERLGEDMGRAWRNYRLVSHGRQRLGRHDTWGWRFTTDMEGPEGEPMRVHGRADIYLPEGRSSGLYVVTIVTEHAADMPDAEEIGESGELRAIFNSLSFDEGRSPSGDDRPPRDDADEEPR